MKEKPKFGINNEHDLIAYAKSAVLGNEGAQQTLNHMGVDREEVLAGAALDLDETAWELLKKSIEQRNERT